MGLFNDNVYGGTPPTTLVFKRVGEYNGVPIFRDEEMDPYIPSEYFTHYVSPESNLVFMPSFDSMENSERYLSVHNESMSLAERIERQIQHLEEEPLSIRKTLSVEEVLDLYGDVVPEEEMIPRYK